MTKTITPLPREGNAPPRIAETAHGMLNAIGLANPGRERFLADTLPRLRELGVPLWVSVGGFCAADYAETCAALADLEAIELNLSCPNVDEAADSAAEIVAACRRETGLPLYAKLSAAHPDVAEVARAVAAAGADGLSLVNTLRGMALHPRTLQPVLARGQGGLSGPSLKPVALATVHACYARDEAADRRHGRSRDRAGRSSSSPPAVRATSRSGRSSSGTRMRLRACAPSWPDSTPTRRSRRRTDRRTCSLDPRQGIGSIDRSCRRPPRRRKRTPRLRSLDQRMDALKRANDVRVRRAKLKKDLKDGRVRIEQILGNPPEYVSTAKVIDILMAVPKFGRVKAARFLNTCRISQSKTVGGLSDRQRAELIDLFHK